MKKTRHHVLAYALAIAASGLLARGGGPGTVLVRTGHVGTGIEALRFLYWAPQVRPQPSDGHRRTRAEHHSDPSRAVYSLDGCTKLPELLGRCVLRVPAAADLARARETGHECSCCITVADTVSVTDNHAEMQSGAHGRQSHSQVEPCLH